MDLQMKPQPAPHKGMIAKPQPNKTKENFSNNLIKVSRLQHQNPCLRELKPNSYKFVDSSNSTTGDSISEDF